MTMKLLNEINQYLDDVKVIIDALPRGDIEQLMNLLIDARDQGQQIFTMGNGGSAATASHMVVDFNKGLSYGFDKRFRFYCLNDNVPTMLAYGNDLNYEAIFVEPLKNLMRVGDLVVGISGSGNSKNIINAIDWANDNGGVTIGICGYDGGKLKQRARYNVHVPSNSMQIVEDLHMMLDHLMYTVLHLRLQDASLKAGPVGKR